MCINVIMLLVRLMCFQSSECCVSNADVAIVPVPMSADNYCYLVIDEADKTAVLIDPADPEAIQVIQVISCWALLWDYHYQKHQASAGLMQMWLLCSTYNHTTLCAYAYALAKNRGVCIFVASSLCPVAFCLLATQHLSYTTLTHTG